MQAIPHFDRRPARHVVIERIARGPWIERARFAEITDAGDYAVSRKAHYQEVFASIGFETMVVSETKNVTDDGRRGDRPTLDHGIGDGRMMGVAWPHFDS